MKADQKSLFEFLRGKKQIIIPIYQRPYSWTSEQCHKLWDDIQEMMTNDSVKEHFVGSIVLIEKKRDTRDVPQPIIIDGQQRITTVLLLIAALLEKIENKERVDELREEYLINRWQKDELKYRMLLTQKDRSSLIDIIDGRHNRTNLASKRIKENFDSFKKKVEKEDPEKILSGIRKLIIVNISLDPDHDNPQLIFESLNSTGLELSQADLIRNYVLMGLDPDRQNDLYDNYWRILEEEFEQTKDGQLFDKFMRDYLTVKTGTIPNIKNVYDTFKKYHSEKGGVENVKELVSDICKYSKFFVKIALDEEEDRELKEAFANLNELKVHVAYPFLLNVYKDYEEKLIDKNEFLEILDMTQSYIFRRFICGISTQSLNKIFPNLYKSINKDDYIESLKAVFVLMAAYYNKFPSDAEFKKALLEKDLYNMKNRNFLFKRFENYKRKERVNVEEYTIEHIMPQNPNLSKEWISMLGDNWKDVWEKYLHTLGNLTLTGYNSELSDNSFDKKKTIKGGFNDSPLYCNNSLRDVDVWNEEAIKNRAATLSETLLKIWSYPKVSEESLEKYKEKDVKTRRNYSIEDHPYLKEGLIRDLFDAVRKRILNIDSSVRENVVKDYIAYKAVTNFVCIVPQKKRLLLFLTIDYGKIYDPKNLCEDFTDKGHYGTGDTGLELSDSKQLEDVLNLIKQSFDKNLED